MVNFAESELSSRRLENLDFHFVSWEYLIEIHPQQLMLFGPSKSVIAGSTAFTLDLTTGIYLKLKSK